MMQRHTDLLLLPALIYDIFYGFNFFQFISYLLIYYIQMWAKALK